MILLIRLRHFRKPTIPFPISRPIMPTNKSNLSLHPIRRTVLIMLNKHSKNLSIPVPPPQNFRKLLNIKRKLNKTISIPLFKSIIPNIKYLNPRIRLQIRRFINLLRPMRRKQIKVIHPLVPRFISVIKAQMKRQSRRNSSPSFMMSPFPLKFRII